MVVPKPHDHSEADRRFPPKPRQTRSFVCMHFQKKKCFILHTSCFRLTTATNAVIEQNCPFTTSLLRYNHEEEPQFLESLLPASYCLDSAKLITPSQQTTLCIQRELNLDRLARIHNSLWFAGLPILPRPLHHQLLLSREIFITERMDMHLVWTTGRIFLKPIPRFLLDVGYWKEYLHCVPGSCHGCYHDTIGIPSIAPECNRDDLRRIATGFLVSYTALITHESDFHMATSRNLLPPGLDWFKWRLFVQEMHSNNIYPHVHSRFHYGELRLSRLNKIHFFYQTPLRGYMTRWDRYGAFFRDYFAWLASSTIYIAIVLTAMQVGLGTTVLSESRVFQSASRRFAVFAILGPLVAAFIAILGVCGVYVHNFVKTIRFNNQRGGILAHVS